MIKSLAAIPLITGAGATTGLALITGVATGATGATPRTTSSPATASATASPAAFLSAFAFSAFSALRASFSNFLASFSFSRASFLETILPSVSSHTNLSLPIVANSDFKHSMYKSLVVSITKSGYTSAKIATIVSTHF